MDEEMDEDARGDLVERWPLKNAQFGGQEAKVSQWWHSSPSFSVPMSFSLFLFLTICPFFFQSPLWSLYINLYNFPCCYEYLHCVCGTFYPSLLSFTCDCLICKCTPLIKWNQVLKMSPSVFCGPSPTCLKPSAPYLDLEVGLSHPSPWDSPTSFTASLILTQPIPPPSSTSLSCHESWGPTQSLLPRGRLKMVYLPKTLPPPPVFSVLIWQHSKESVGPSTEQEREPACMIHGSPRMSERDCGGCGSNKCTKKRGLIEPSQARPWRCCFGVFLK